MVRPQDVVLVKKKKRPVGSKSRKLDINRLESAQEFWLPGEKYPSVHFVVMKFRR